MSQLKTYKDVRGLFKNFFKNNDHAIIPSSPIFEEGDDSLLFTNSGMVQFKNIFTGKQKSQVKTASTIQKCIRAGGKHNDLDNVGYTNRHHTFFEMLGNFSFGDYFKEQAIYYAHNFLIKELGLPLEKLYFTVFYEDIEAFNLWKKIAGVSDEKIIKINGSDNFWSMGDTGPCGPCSEIFFDYGEGVFGGLPGSKDQDGPRYTEIWNLVFMQYEKHLNGSMAPLDKKSIDTGMGLERLMSVLEGKTDNYQTSLFSELKTGFIKYFPQSFLNEKTSEFTLRILADHIRSSVFMICDGVTPSNEERGYVLRRIIRRALRHAYIGGVKEPFLYKQVDSVISLMGDEYSELYRAKDFIKSALKLEEESFLKVLPDGLSILNKEIEKLGSAKILSGEIAFKLYDTYGFPVDITEDILQKYGIKIDYQGFNKEMEAQKTRSRESWSGSSVLVDGGLLKLSDNFTKTEFAGYNHTSLMAKILCFEKVENKTVIVFDKTPFYPEGGGQSCDVGVIENSAGKAVFNVEHVKKINGVIFHFGSVIGGADAMLTIGAQVNCVINQEVRKLHCQGHTATHILHYVLRQKFGNSIAQKGSLIERSGFRFDFSHPKALTDIEVIEVENVVNYLIRSNFNVTSFITDKQTAIKDGVTALFGEKYDDSVRVVKCGDSAELCGGTHVEYSGNIGLFKIISERGVSSGVRRIEAKVGFFALEYVNLIVKKYNDALLFQKLQQKLTSIYNIDWSGCLQNLSYSSGTSPSVSGLSVNFATVENELLANISDLKTKCKSLENRVDELIEDFIFERKVTFIKASNGFDIAVYEVNTSKHDIKSITKIIMSKKAIPFDSILVILNGIDCIFKTKTNDFDAINVLSRLKNGVPSGNKFCAIMKCNTSVDAVISGVLLG